jgi:hypothetical protein
MKDRKTVTSNIIRLLILSMVVFLLFRIFYLLFINYRIKKHEGTSVFEITSIVPISVNRITEAVEFYNKDKFIEYDCLIDSIIHIHVIKVGDHFDGNISEVFSFTKKGIPEHNDWFEYQMKMPPPSYFCQILNQYCSSFNVFTLPMNRIETICAYVNGKEIHLIDKSETNLYYSIRAQSISYSFNHETQADLITSLFGNDPPISYLMVCIDKEKRVYVVNISSVKGDCPPLDEIFD